MKMTAPIRAKPRGAPTKRPIIKDLESVEFEAKEEADADAVDDAMVFEPADESAVTVAVETVANTVELELELIDVKECSFGLNTIVPNGTVNELPSVQQLIFVPQQYWTEPLPNSDTETGHFLDYPILNGLNSVQDQRHMLGNMRSKMPNLCKKHDME